MTSTAGQRRHGLPTTVRIVYVDLDGTLFGPSGSLFEASDASVTASAAEALTRLHRAEVAVVPMSGRTASQVREVARALGADGFIAELGGIVARDGEVERRHGEAPPGIVPVEAMLRSGAAGFLLDRFAGRLVPHRPWPDLRREVTLLFRGDIGADDPGLARSGYAWLAFADNGVIPRTFADLDLEEQHLYHLAPRGVTKAAAVTDDLRARGLPPEHAVVVGDSPADLEAGMGLGATFLVANGAWAAGPDDAVHITEASYGEGFAEAIEALYPG